MRGELVPVFCGGVGVGQQGEAALLVWTVMDNTMWRGDVIGPRFGFLELLGKRGNGCCCR